MFDSRRSSPPSSTERTSRRLLRVEPRHTHSWLEASHGNHNASDVEGRLDAASFSGSWAERWFGVSCAERLDTRLEACLARYIIRERC
jgi:hypothetical protein